MDLFDTVVLNRLVASRKQPSTFLRDVFFPTVETHDSKFIAFDTEQRKLRLTPFVHPTVAGRLVENQGTVAERIEAPYVKDKRRFDPDRPLRRAPGEQIGGTQLTPQQRRELALLRSMDDQLRMLAMREEVMVSESLRTGRVTISGEGFPTQQIDYRRDAALTVTLTGNDRWGQSGVDPVETLEANAQLVQDEDGSIANVVVFEPKAWGRFRAADSVKAVLDTRRGSTSQAELGPLDGRKARMVGVIGDFECWVYQEAYVDEDGVARKVMPDWAVIQGARDIEGVRAYASIQDEEANYEASQYFVKSWLEKDPAVRWLLMQSAPLPIPYRPNATLGMIVDGGA